MKKNGFTLIELMIAVAIIGILAAIAYPSYVEHVKSGRRGEAKADLSELTQFMERYYTEKNTYIGATLPFTASPRTGTAAYTLSVTLDSAKPDEFLVRAVPTGVMAGDVCGTLSIDHKGAKLPTTPAKCW